MDLLSGREPRRGRFLGADLSGADLSHTSLDGADLRNADLKGIAWQNIQTVKLANLYGVKNPPEGFVAWALRQGAVQIESDSEWQAREASP